MKVARYRVRRSHGSASIGTVLASSLEVAHAIARARWGHFVAVGTTGRAVWVPFVRQPPPNPLPEVEYFGVGFYPAGSVP